ncbi:hypothetical protein Pst134EA_015950 [Puccinia striiformis f. sp. tritici]|uniref:Aquaporin n=1 Tax=Puccinia striiformis f. sp. tritici PST-78 TaxID=1165861 RepID=A0A0L0UXK4_9BASI|nr:hypothetical protein Pst134EA_015950 [Puccinia striiformis f. sp. tritici]KAH9453090.1 hypothetical protein Pst134EB_017024 [Puccinia striiformis f. sp. tritici]KAH9463870.1 hypothetical protein Pst134EA_015950 [Puccinia striiformis f. sp. tritici]KAI9605329.1 hypothetical protein KEM48_002269 [Puccinia striiformis f. sp. tritici PST-130]KNE91782.1 hypothetical protein PSTG_14799 [Puccinia striiformis f. sp. tritici PST-78]
MAANTSSMEGFLAELKRDLLASVAEYLGTTVFLLMGLGGIQAAAISNEAAKEASRTSVVNEVASVSQLLYISTSMALALLASAWTFFRISGSVFNPNVAIALALTGALKPIRFILYVVAEILAGITASAILNAILPGALAVGCGLGVETKVWQGLVIEALLTGILTITVLFLAVEKHRATPFAPVAIGLVLFATHMFGVVFTGAAMNSARAFGPDVITGFKSYHWIYWIGPSIGSIVAAMIYLFLKSVDYESFNPKQDSDLGQDSPDLQGIEVKMRRRTTQFEKANEFGYPAGGAQNPMPANFGLVSAPYPTSVYHGNTTDVCAPANPLPYGSSRPQSPVLRARNGAPSINGAMSTIASARQLNSKGFSTNGVHVEHHENVDMAETLSPMTDGFVQERRTHYPTGSVC